MLMLVATCDLTRTTLSQQDSQATRGERMLNEAHGAVRGTRVIEIEAEWKRLLLREELDNAIY